jgi:toxin FitB
VSGYLVDTNVLSELRRKSRAHPLVVQWASQVPEETLFTSVLVFGEIRKGIEQLRSTDRPQALVLDRWFHETENLLGKRILPVTGKIADEWGRISSIRPLPVVDALLAATAIVHDLTLVTRNTADVHDLGAKLLNPFLPQ